MKGVFCCSLKHLSEAVSSLVNIITVALKMIAETRIDFHAAFVTVFDFNQIGISVHILVEFSGIKLHINLLNVPRVYAWRQT
jgi:hypothetical protein